MTDKIKEDMVDVVIEIRDLLKYQVRLLESLVENRKSQKPVDVKEVMNSVKEMLGGKINAANIFEKGE
jgi:hypothetical protein